MPVVCNICTGAAQKCTFVNKDLYPTISGWPTLIPAPKGGLDDDTRPKRRTTRSKGKKVAVAPALEVRSVSKRGTSSSSSFLHPNDSRGLGVAVASGSGFGNSLMRAPECRVVLEDLLPYEELLKSTSAITLRLGITRLQSARRRQQAELEGVACTVEEHDGLMGILLNELDDAWHQLTGTPKDVQEDEEVEEAAERVARHSLDDSSHEVERNVLGDR